MHNSASTIDVDRTMTTGSQRNQDKKVVADLFSRKFVTIPSWFTASAALRVVRLKGVRHAFVEDRGRMVGLIDDRRLRGAGPHDPVARWMSKTDTFVGPETSRSAALALLRQHQTECLPVFSGSVLLGIVTRDDLDPEPLHPQREAVPVGDALAA